MLTAGPGKKVGIYVAEEQQYHGRSIWFGLPTGPSWFR